MHKLYGVFDFNGERYLEKLTVEEFPDAKFTPLRRLYNLQDIKIEPLKHIEFKDNPLAQSVFNGSEISISQLFKIVKYSDKDFYVNKSQSLDETRSTYSTTPPTERRKTEANQNFPTISLTQVSKMCQSEIMELQTNAMARRSPFKF